MFSYRKFIIIDSLQCCLRTLVGQRKFGMSSKRHHYSEVRLAPPFIASWLIGSSIVTKRTSDDQHFGHL